MARPAVAFVLWASAIGALAAAAPPSSHAVAACDGLEDFTSIEGQGPSCRIDGLWTVLLSTGEQILTHGSDPIPTGTPLGAPPRQPACVGATEHRNEVIYARPIDRVGRHSWATGPLRSLVAQANGRLYADAVANGVGLDYSFLCDRGAVVVHYAVLPSTSAGDSFASIVSDLQRLGYRDPRVKYWVLYDDDVAGQASGQGNIHRDDRAVVDNANNGGPDYGISYGVFDARLLMHENAHNMGAVQRSAPNASGGWHCNDGLDVMCYADGGPSSSYSATRCSAVQFDCGYDDYFHPAPPAGSYLATHWNVGSPLNRFLLRSAPPPPAPAPAPAPVRAPAPEPGPSPAPRAPDTRAPFLRLRTVLRPTRARVLRRGVPVRAACSEPCRLVLQLRTRGGRPRVLGQARTGLSDGAPRWSVVRLTRYGRSLLGVRRRATLALRVRVVDGSGNARTVGRVLRVRP